MMKSPKRKADAVSPHESLDESPHKRARSETIDDTANKQHDNSHSSSELSDEDDELSIALSNPQARPPAARDIQNEAAPLKELPESWVKADAADQMIMRMKVSHKSYAQIGQEWKRMTGAKPAKGMLLDRWQRLKKLPVTSAANGQTSEPKVTGQSLKDSDDTSMLPNTKVRPSSPAISGPSDKPSDIVLERLATVAENSKSAVGDSTHKPSDANSILSKSAAIPSKTASAAPASDDNAEQDLPQSWEQADAGDQLIVKMRTFKYAWPRIEKAWQKLTGKEPAEGALENRYMCIKDLVVKPGRSARTDKHKRAEPTLGTPRKRKAKAGPSLESLDDPLVESSDESSDGPSNEPNRKRTKPAAKQPENGILEAESSDESDGNLEQLTSGAQSTAEAADLMVVEMRERGCTFPEISRAWAERTGLTRVPETLRKRYDRIKGDYATKLKSTAQTSSNSGKRKAKATSPDEHSYDSSLKRRKPKTESPRISETPVKRNMDRGKRKHSVKYADSTTDEDELFAAPVEPVATTPAKRNAGRAAKVNRSDPEWLVTNEKSPLAYEDLHAEFSDPKTYENFTKSDWEDLRETLPPDIAINPDGYSIPMAFFKYDADFRRGIREFQEDLASGRLDPQWQADAAQAMEERARGEFDAYKENQFEAFWGQKQKSSVHNALAGESTKIKLEFLIQNGIFKVGDYLSYSRTIGRGKSGVLVEKDCKIVKIEDKVLTVAIPPGQRKYSRRMFEAGNGGDSKLEARASSANRDDPSSTGIENELDTAQVVIDAEINRDEAPEGSEKGDGASNNNETAESSKDQETELTIENKTDSNDAAEATLLDNTDMDANEKAQENTIHEASASEGIQPNGVSSQTNGTHSSTPALEEEDVLHSISYLTQLEHKIVDVDGRFKSEEVPTVNPWKAIRALRNNQDLGSLFEMRDEFFVYKHPQIVKEGKKKR